MTYFSGVTIDVRSTGVNQVAVKYVGFEPQHRLMEFAILGFFRKALEISGAKQITADFSTAAAENRGYWELDLKWSAK
jgi:hypothetical protein